jgi:putative protease
MEYQFIGRVTHFFDRLSVAVIQLEDELFVDDWILVDGPRTELEQQVLSMQVNREPIDKGVRGDEVAIKVDDVVHEGDKVFLIVE